MLSSGSLARIALLVFLGLTLADDSLRVVLLVPGIWN